MGRTKRKFTKKNGAWTYETKVKQTKIYETDFGNETIKQTKHHLPQNTIVFIVNKN